MLKRKFVIYTVMISMMLTAVTGCGFGSFSKWGTAEVSDEYQDKEWKAAYTELVESWTDGTIDSYIDAESLRFDLVYINEDEMPELIVSGDEWIYMYTYCPGSVASGVSDVNVLMEEWWWDASANTGYYYLPYENVIQNSILDSDSHTVVYFQINENLALTDWYQIWYDITATENDNIYTYFYEGPENLGNINDEMPVEGNTEETEVSMEQNSEEGVNVTSEVDAEEDEASVKKITKEVTEEEWLLYNHTDVKFEFLQGTMEKDEILVAIEECFVSVEGAPVFDGLQPINYKPENDSAHRLNYYEMITLLEETLPKHNIQPEATEGDIEIISISEGDIGTDGKRDVAVILKSCDPSVSGWDDYGRYALVVCVFTEIDGAYKCTAINHSMVTSNDMYYDADNYEYAVEIAAGDLTVSYTVKDGDNRECSNYIFELKGNLLILSRLETDYSSEASGCGELVKQNVLTGEVVSIAYSDLKDSFVSWQLYSAICESVTLSFDKVTRWQIPQIDESTIVYAEKAQEYDYKALWLDEYLTDEQPVEGESVETLEPWKIAYLELLQAVALGKTNIYNKELSYKLIYINDDEIPELVASNNGYFVSVFTYAPEGEYADVKGVNVILENCSYGAMGNVGYYYLPKDNIIYNYNSDYAGGAGTTWYGFINENSVLESKYTIYFEDIDMQDDSEEYRYYFNGKEISQDLYSTYQIDGNFKFIEGNKKAYEIVEDIVEF